jgi:dimethylaniline monooxygenase (N-oxide forming)
MSSSVVQMPCDSVAIIGAGPAGLVTARWLKQYGFRPVLFEAADQLGGQWNSSSSMSGTWPEMRTNTSRPMSAFSDMQHSAGTSLFPSQADMLAYLHRYAGKFDLVPAVRSRTRVTLLEREPQGGWRVESIRNGQPSIEIYQRAVVASGRYVEAQIPPVSGLETFSGVLGAIHTSQYDGAARYRDKAVVIAGCSISALEISSDLALAGARSVTTCYRRQRYILPKIIAGVPTDQVMFTRAAALAGEQLPLQELAQIMRNAVTGAAGSPEQFGAQVPSPNIFEAGISQSQHFLPLVADGRITTRPWIRDINQRTIHFDDGSRVAADALLFGTGFRLSLPWLSPGIAAMLDLDEQHLDLYDHTFNSGLPGLAFVGLYDQTGPYLPVLELQARWIAYTAAGVRPAPTPAEMAAGERRYQERRHLPQNVPMHAMALLFARHAGVEPDLSQWPDSQPELLNGPLTPQSFRISGPDRWQAARDKSMAA